MRERFLAEPTPTKPFSDYWHSSEYLQLYHLTFAQRIHWKWQSILEDLVTLGWQPTNSQLVDWGCGTGIAALSVLERFPIFQKLQLWDRSKNAVEFSEKSIKTDFPKLEIITGATPPEPPFTLLLSHVLTELPPTDQQKLLHFISAAENILWVEPGTLNCSRRLIEIREELKGQFHIVAPCPHEEVCGLLSRPRDWCHQFAKIPSEIFQSAFWRKFGNTLKIDLRSLPLSYLVLQKKEFKTRASKRMLGRPVVHKHALEWLECNPNLIEEKRVLRKEDPKLYKELLRLNGCLSGSLS